MTMSMKKQKIPIRNIRRRTPNNNNSNKGSKLNDFLNVRNELNTFAARQYAHISFVDLCGVTN